MGASEVNLSSFDCSSIHVVRNHFIAGTSCLKDSKGRIFPIRDNVCGACYIVSGEGKIVDDRSGRQYPFFPGCFIQWIPDDPHTRIVPPNTLYVDKYFVFPAEFYWIFQKMGLTSPEHPVVELGLRAEIAAGYDEIIRELQYQSELRLPLTIEKAFSFVLNLLEADFQEKCSIPSLARSMKMSHTSFRRIFARFYKMSPMEYRIRRKIEKIQLLLSTQDLRLKEVADRFGYADVYTFSHQFKKVTGISPADFRKQNGIFSRL